MIVGLTGGTGTGKTSISKFFADAGFKIIDYDKVTREIYTKDSECLNEIVAAFGSKILNDDGTLNRRALGEIVFADKSSLDILNKIVYKYIISHTKDVLNRFKNEYLLLDAPTLFESGLNQNCDFIVGVVARKDLKIKRVSQRDGLEPQRVADRINSQMSDDFFKQNCDFLIENSGTLLELEQKTKEIIKKLKS